MDPYKTKSTTTPFEKTLLAAPVPEMDRTRHPPRRIEATKEKIGHGPDKIPLRLLADYCVARHAEECLPDDPIILRSLQDIDIFDKGKYKIWVDNDQVFLLVNCPGEVHEATATALSAGIGIKYIRLGGSVTCTIENQLGCHIRFNKAPDASIDRGAGPYFPRRSEHGSRDYGHFYSYMYR